MYWKIPSFYYSLSFYFIEIETQATNFTNNYDLGFDFDFLGVGEITAEDSFYCCNETEKYYFDDLNDSTFRAGDEGVEVGDAINISVFSDDFEPVIFVLNAETGEVIDFSAVRTSVTLGSSTFDVAELEIIVEDNINYLVSIETIAPEQTGDYGITVS